MQETGLVKSNIDFPQIIINSIPAPELIFETISEEELMPYVDGLKELDLFKADFIVMVCNTIHLYIDRLQKEIRTSILDLKEEIRKYLLENKIESVLVLGSPNTIKQGLYKFQGINTIEPTEKEMKQLTDSIFNFNKGTDKTVQIEKVREICRKYLDEGAQTVILGCTELAVMLQNENFSKIDPMDVLISSVVKKHF